MDIAARARKRFVSLRIPGIPWRPRGPLRLKYPSIHSMECHTPLYTLYGVSTALTYTLHGMPNARNAKRIPGIPWRPGRTTKSAMQEFQTWEPIESR